MLVLQRLLNLLYFFLCLTTVGTLALSHPVSNESTRYKSYVIQYPMDSLSNNYNDLISPETFLLAQKGVPFRTNKQGMTPEQRERFQERRKRFESLSPEEKKRIKEARKRFKRLSTEEQERLRKKWRALSPKERRKAIKKKRKKKSGV